MRAVDYDSDRVFALSAGSVGRRQISPSGLAHQIGIPSDAARRDSDEAVSSSLRRVVGLGWAITFDLREPPPSSS